MKEFWNKNAANYDEHMRASGHYDAQKQVSELLKENIQSPILDLAAGPGYLAGILLAKDHCVTLNELSPKMLVQASDKYSHYPKSKFTQSDAQNITVNQKFKTIICCNLFYYLQSREKAIQDWKNHLTTDGAIIVIEEYPFQIPSSESLEGRELANLIKPISITEIKNYFKDFTLIREVKTPIDDQHDLYGLVFKK